MSFHFILIIRRIRRRTTNCIKILTYQTQSYFTTSKKTRITTTSAAPVKFEIINRNEFNNKMSKEFYLVVFGASGFTGQHVVEEVAVSMNSDDLYKKENYKWAIAGRSKEKLEKVLKEAQQYTSIDLHDIPIIIADIEDYQSLVSMCKRTRLVISVIGPYRFYGEPVVKACIEGESNYVDISGEPQFLEGMQLKYHAQAKAKKIFMVGAAGWDSIPSDLGTSWTKKIFPGQLSGVEIVVTTRSRFKPELHYGTWVSAIYGLAMKKELGPLRRKLFKDVMPYPRQKPVHQLPKRSVITSFVETGPGYCTDFPGSDRSVVNRSEIFKYVEHKEKPVQCATYIKLGSLQAVLSTLFVASIFAIMSHFKLGRYLLEQYPSVFSFGIASHKGPSREHMAARTFANYIIGYGWDEKYDDPEREHSNPPQKKIVTKVSGPDPGYIATSSFVVHSGITLLKDRDDLPGEGGVLSPGAAFCNTHLIERLSKRGITFEVIEGSSKY